MFCLLAFAILINNEWTFKVIELNFFQKAIDKFLVQEIEAYEKAIGKWTDKLLVFGDLRDEYNTLSDNITFSLLAFRFIIVHE